MQAKIKLKFTRIIPTDNRKQGAYIQVLKAGQKENGG